MDAKLLIPMETTKQKFGYLNQDHNCEAAKKEMAAFFGEFICLRSGRKPLALTR